MSLNEADPGARADLALDERANVGLCAVLQGSSEGVRSGRQSQRKGVCSSSWRPWEDGLSAGVTLAGMLGDQPAPLGQEPKVKQCHPSLCASSGHIACLVSVSAFGGLARICHGERR